MAVLGANIIRGINRSINNERASMQQRFSDEVNSLRWAEGIAYRDKNFDEGVRRFGLEHALREAAGNRDQIRLDDTLKTTEQLRGLRTSAEGRAVDVHQHMTENVYPYQAQVTREFVAPVNVQRREDAAARLDEKGRILHERLTDPDAQELWDKNLEYETERVTQGIEQLQDPNYQKWTRYQPIFNMRNAKYQDIINRYAAENIGIPEPESPYDAARREYLELQIENYGQPEPMTEFQSKYLGPYYDALGASLGNRSGSNPYKDPTFAQQRSIATDEKLLDMMGEYMRERTGKGIIFGWDIDEPWERVSKTPVMTNEHGKRAPQQVLDKDGKPVYRDDPRDSSVKALEAMGIQMMNMLEDEFNNNPLLAYNRLNSLMNAFLLTDHGQEMMGKWRKNMRGMSDDYIIQQAKAAFLEGARQHPTLQAMFEEMRKKHNLPTTTETQLDTQLR